MLTLLGSLLGFTTSFLPSILDYFNRRQDHEQDLEKMRVQMELASMKSELKLSELDAQADIEESKGIYKHDRTIDGGNFINGLRGSVRPILTYLFFIMFAITKCTLIYALIANQNVDWTQAIQMAWDSESGALFAAVMSFWFGGRAVNKYMNRN